MIMACLRVRRSHGYSKLLLVTDGFITPDMPPAAREWIPPACP